MGRTASRVTNSRPQLVHLIWGVLDASYVARYVWTAIQTNRIPYFSDLIAIQKNYEFSGIIIGVTYAYTAWILSVSIIFSSILLLFQHGSAKLFCYAQTPLRIVAMIPSIWLIGEASVWIPGGIAAVAIIVVVSEIIKVGSLWKLG